MALPPTLPQDRGLNRGLTLTYISRLKKTKSGFWLLARRRLSANFFGCPESGFIRHQPSPPCCPNVTPVRSKLCIRGAQWRSQCHVCPGSQDCSLGSVSKKLGDDIVKATGDGKSLRITVVEAGHLEQVGSSASALILKALEEPERQKETEKS